MRRRAALALVAGLVIAAGAAAIFLTTASAGPPPMGADISVAPHPRPVAGQLFTGLIVNGSQTSDMAIIGVSCDARIDHHRLPAQLQRFYRGGYSGPAAITCTWRIPASAAAGDKLRLDPSSAVMYADGDQIPIFSSSWRIRG